MPIVNMFRPRQEAMSVVAAFPRAVTTADTKRLVEDVEVGVDDLLPTKLLASIDE
jgi:hypothetical protein